MPLNYFANTKLDGLDVIEASDLEAIEDGFEQVDTDKANKAAPAVSSNIAGLAADGDLEDLGEGIPAGGLVGVSKTQTLTNKTLSAPVISGGSSSGMDINGGVIGGSSPPAATLSSAIINGNLTVHGTTSTFNSEIYVVEDPVVTLGGATVPTSDDSKDRGVEYRWHDGSTAKIGFFGYDNSTGRLTFIPDATNTGEVFSGDLGDVSFGNIFGASFNGRMIEADGAKLDLIEDDATADQSGSEIKTAYENEADTNALTDSLLAKINSLDDFFLGVFTVDPTQTASAGPLVSGHLYLNSVVPEYRVYDGSAWGVGLAVLTASEQAAQTYASSAADSEAAVLEVHGDVLSLLSTQIDQSTTITQLTNITLTQQIQQTAALFNMANLYLTQHGA